MELEQLNKSELVALVRELRAEIMLLSAEQYDAVDASLNETEDLKDDISSLEVRNMELERERLELCRRVQVLEFELSNLEA